METKDLEKSIDQIVTDPNWNKIFKDNIDSSKGAPAFNFNIEAMAKNMKKFQSDLAVWKESYGLWPGRAFAQFAAYSRWIHLSTNTLPFYNVFPRLQDEFPSNDFNIFGSDESTGNHWLHKTASDSEQFHLANRMHRWLRHKDGAHVLLMNKSETGTYYLRDRGTDYETGTKDGEYIPEHVHHNYLHTDAYEKSREARGVEGADKGEFLEKGKWSQEWYDN